MQKNEKKNQSLRKSIILGLAILAGLVVYAYGFQVTQVSLDEISSPRRQESLTRVLRALARPDILEYEKAETTIVTPIYVPCPSGNPAQSQPDTSGAYLVVSPACADPRTEVQIEGFNFQPNTEGPLAFIPTSEVTLNLGTFKTDETGHFVNTARLPARPDEAVQQIRAITRVNVGSPHFTQTAKATWDKIVETVFLALLATTLGVFLAIPISFFAARNLMKDITSTLSGLALSILAWPAGIWLGGLVSGWIGEQIHLLTGNSLLSLASIAVSAGLVWFPVRWALPQEEERRPGLGLRIARLAVLIFSGLAIILVLFLVAHLATIWGLALAERLGAAGFLGTFLANLGEILNLIITLIAALAGGGILAGAAGKLEKAVFLKLPLATRAILNLLLGAIAGAVLAILLGAGINWLYQINDPVKIVWAPAGVGAVLGLFAAILTRQRDVLPVGLVIYYVTRTILNALRAIEALIMAIVFVVWVGIGPFAGVLALSLHTIAALAKLYSEQVESISTGPLEAIRATGATRLQTVIYGVIPQIIPPYISFTMYRWDINVRMSTIIGFAGGGGIGFLLIQNINLLNYRAASAQMLAIAIVVAMMDFLSSYMRERVV